MVAPAQLTSKQWSQTLAQAPIPQSDVDRKQKMLEAWAAYHGKLPDPLKVRKNEPNDNIKSNRCGPVAKKTTSWLFGQVVKIACEDDSNQEYLDGFWGDDDDKMTFLAKLAINGAVCGQVFVKIVPAQGSMKYPRMVIIDPQIIRIVSDPEDCDLHLAYIIEYPVANGIQKRQIIARVDPNNTDIYTGNLDLDDTWTITTYQRKSINSSLSTTGWNQVGEVIEWPYPFPPIFTCQNLPTPNEAWGEPDITEDLIRLNKAINFIQSNIGRILKYFAHPKMWTKGVAPDQIQMAIEDVMSLQSPDAAIGLLEMQSDLHSSLNFLQYLLANGDEESRVPAVALGRQSELPKGNLSGVALALLFQPLIELIVQKQRTYGRLIRELSRAALVLNNEMISIADFEDYKIELHWSPLLPSDNLQSAQEAILLQQLGVSMDTILSGLGMNATDEAQKRQEEDAQQVKNYAQGQGLPPAQPVQPNQQPAMPGQPAPQQQEVAA